MKRKGFTLIELLAVIVVLAIIALIATPIVMNVIKNAQAGAAERSADNYIKAVETLIATEKLDGNTIEDGSYTITSTGKLTIGQEEHEVEVSGTKPVGGTIVVKKGTVDKDESSIQFGDYTVTYEEGKAQAKENIESNSELEELCDLVDGTANTIGAKYTCNLGNGAKTFYVLEPGDESSPATLILEGNYDLNLQSYCNQAGANPDNNVCEGDGIAVKLDEIASVWTKLNRSQIGIPSAEQIMVADGKEEGAYLDKPTLNNRWLYSYPEYADWHEGYGPVWGYWTSTPDAGASSNAWVVRYDGYVRSDLVGRTSESGVRPVITLSI